LLHIEVKTQGVERLLDLMEERIAAFGSVDMPSEMLAWQSQDMRRKYPHQETPDSNTVETTVWPRSRRSAERRQKAKAQAAAGIARVRPPRLVQPKIRMGSGLRRPILRPELIQRLHERMIALLQDKLKWR
jgi:hypothetical protein